MIITEKSEKSHKNQSFQKSENPAIRFDGFVDPWEQRKLSYLLEKYEDPVETPHDGYERLGIRSHAKGTFHSYVEAGKELETAKMHRVASDKFILNITFAWEHAVAITDEKDAGKLVSHRFPQFTFDKKLQSSFFKYLMLDMRFKKHLELSSPGGAGRNRVLKISDMLKYEIMLPSVNEQMKIGVLFSNLDNLITLQKRKCDKLVNVKKSMLEKMFPRDGADVPEVRFTGFTGAWEQHKVSDVVGVYDGTHQTPNYQDHGVMFVSVEDIQTLKSEKYISKEDYEKNYSVVPEFGDILMTRIGDIGTANIVKSERPLAYYVSLALLKNTQLNSEFLKANISAPAFQNELWLRTLHTAYPKKINKDEIGKCMISVAPSSEEQEEIGYFFANLDNLITLHQRKLEKMKNIKKAMLERMFV